jgi:hypothetical protein
MVLAFIILNNGIQAEFSLMTSSVVVNVPSIIGNTVVFSWRYAEPENSPFQSDSVIVRYEEEVDLSWEITSNIFCGLILPIIDAKTTVPLSIVLPAPMDGKTYAWWSRFHQFRRVQVGPESLEENPDRVPVPPDGIPDAEVAAGLLFGGGKDSLCTLGIMREVYAERKTHILRLVWGATESMRSQREALIKHSSLDILQDRFAHPVHMVATDLHSQLKESKDAKHADIALYWTTMLPLIKKHNISLMSFAYDCAESYTHRDGVSLKAKPFRRSRPETLIHIVDLYQRVLGRRFTIKNFSTSLSPVLNFRILCQLYQDLMPVLYMCEKPSAKWCYNCRKCFTYAIYSVYFDFEPLDFNLDYFLRKSPYVARLLESIETAGRNKDGNVCYVAGLSAGKHYLATCHILAQLDLASAEKRLSPEGFEIIKTLKAAFGSRSYPQFESFWMSAYDYESATLNNELDWPVRQKVLDLIARAGIPVLAESCIPGADKDIPVAYEFPTSA